MMSTQFLCAAEPLPAAFKGVGVSENIGGQVPLDITLTESNGSVLQTKAFFQGQEPVVLVLAYYSCPMLCNMVVSGVSDAMSKLPFNAGDRYRVVVVSFDPSDTPSKAETFSHKYKELVGGHAVGNGFRFFVGSQAETRRLADSVGFHYNYNPKTKEYAHGASIFFLTPEGKISRYLYGIEFRPADFKLAVLEASDRKQVSTTEKLLLFCYGYDSHARGYGLVAVNIMKIGGLVTILVLGLALFGLNRKYKDRSKRHG